MFMSLTRLAVDRPITTLMAALIVVLLGWEALRRLAVDLLPDVTYPTITVSTLYDGAGPAEIETLITRPLEQTLSSVQGVDRLTSRSQEGSSTIRVRFAWGADLDAAVSDIRAKIEKLRRKLPDEIETPYIRRYDTSDSPVMYLGLISELDPISQTQLAEQSIVPELERIDGVAWVRVRGGVRREIHVDLNRSKLEALNMGVNEVVDALRRENINQPAGDFAEGNVKLLIRSRGEFHSLDEISNTIVREIDGASVRIGDVADVVDGEEERTELTLVNGKPGVLVYIYRQAGANTVDVSDRVRRAIGRINASIHDAELVLRVDKSDFIRQSIENVRLSAVYGMGLAVVVLIVFLRNFRSTLVITVSMPLSVLATFVLVYFQGFTLNMVSFGGLALGIGLLVDNSIVVLESIFRKREDGLSARDAAIDGTREVASAIVASTLTTLIVFLPLAFIGGMTGVLLHQLAWVVCFSLICSLLVSLTLTPVLVAYWIGRKPLVTDRPKLGLIASLAAGLHRLNRNSMSRLERWYESILRISLRNSGAVSFLLLAVFAATLGLIPRVGTEFMPKADEGDLRVNAYMAPGIQLQKLDAQASVLAGRIRDSVPEAQTTVAFIGGDIDDASEWNEASFRLHLTPRSQRRRSVEDIRKDLAAQIGAVAGMRVLVQVRNELYLARMLRTGSGGDISVEVRGHDLKTADELADAVAKIMERVPGLVNVETAKEDRRPELEARIDRAKASLLGVSVSDITQALETTIRGTDATIFREAGDEFNVLARLRETDRSRIADVEQVGVTTPLGKVVPLKTFVDFDPGESPVTINRLDRQRVIEVEADVEDRDLGNAVSDLQSRLNQLPLPDGFSLRIAGDWEQQQESFAALRNGFVLAIVLMYMVMASQFESLRDPLLILVTIPLGVIGVILALVLTSTTLNVQSFIGVVMLSGIVVNNAIVLVDYINQLRRSDQNFTIENLIVKAAVRRFRPILMTTLTTVLAMLPIALGAGEGGELQAPLARVVIGGLTSGTLITLLAIPLIYQAISRDRVAQNRPTR